MTQTIGGELAQRENRPPTPYQIVTKEMAPELSAMLPTHIASEAWLRIAAGALKKGKIEANGRTDLENAAANNPAAFVAALRQAASLGLQPGTEEYWFTTVRNWRNQNKTEILGIVGYQGYVELMYRAGAVESVVVEVVYSTDTFTYVRGRDTRPIHESDWDSDERGELRLAYAYAIMKGGATSKVVVLNKHDIAKIRAKSASWAYDQKNNKETSPWTTDPDAMWLKSAARQLRKWVPTSASYITERIRATRAADDPTPTVPDVHAQSQVPLGHQVQIDDPEDVIEGEVMEDAPAEPQEPVPPAEEQVAVAEEPPLRSATQQRRITTLLQEKGIASGPGSVAAVRRILGDESLDPARLTAPQADTVIAELQKLPSPEQAVAQAAQQ